MNRRLNQENPSAVLAERRDGARHIYMARPLEASSPRNGFAVVARGAARAQRGSCAAMRGVSKDGRGSTRCSHPLRRIAVRCSSGLRDAPQDEVDGLRVPASQARCTFSPHLVLRCSMQHIFASPRVLEIAIFAAYTKASKP
jgi:hypothetical protein